MPFICLKTRWAAGYPEDNGILSYYDGMLFFKCFFGKEIKLIWCGKVLSLFKFSGQFWAFIPVKV